MCFIAFWASSCVSYSMYAKPLFNHGLILSLPNSISLILPKLENISFKWSLLTFLVRRPIWILVGWGVADLFLILGEPLPLLLLPLASGLARSLDIDFLLGGGEGEFLLGADLGSASLWLFSWRGLFARGEDAGSLSESGFRGPDLFFSESRLDLFLFLFLSSLSRLLLDSELDSLLESLELSLLELELEELAFLLLFPLSARLSLLLPFLLARSSSLLSEELRPLLLAGLSCFSLDWDFGADDLSSPDCGPPPAPPVPMLFK